MVNARGKVLAGLTLLTALVGCPNPGGVDGTGASTKPSTSSVKKTPKPSGSPSAKPTKTPATGASPTASPSKSPSPTPTATTTASATASPTPAAGTPTPAGTANPNATATPAGSGKTVATFVGSGTVGEVGLADGKGPAVRFFEPEGIAVAADEIVYVTDTLSHAVRKCATDGTVLTITGNQRPGKTNGKGTAAQFNGPKGLAIAADGTLYIADTGNHQIRKMAVDGTVTTLAGTGTAGKAEGFGDVASFNAPDGIAVGADGAIYVADTGNNRIRRIVIDAGGTGTVSTLAGNDTPGSLDGVGEAASFRAPKGVAVAADGAVFVASMTDNLIRKIVVGGDGKGTVSTVAGSGAGIKDGVGAAASFNQPQDLAIGKDGALYVADQGNGAVRKVVVGADGKGTVSTIAGGGAVMVFANSIGVSPAGKIYVTEIGLSRVALLQ